MREDLGQTECEGRVKNRKCTTKLLARLIEHHGQPCDIAPVEEPEPPAVKIPLIDVKPWFSIVEDSPRGVMVEDIRRAGSQYFKVGKLDLISDRRQAPIVYARQIIMYLCRMLTERSYPDIGRRLGGRDHTTVLHAVAKIERLIKTDWKVAYDVAHVEALI